jgi:hypothetical protein
MGYVWRAEWHASNTGAPWPLCRRSSSLPVSSRWMWCVCLGVVLGCWQKPMLVHGLMTMTLSGAAYLIEGVIRAPFPLPRLCSPLAGGRPGVSPPLFSCGVGSVCPFSLVVLFPRSFLTHAFRCFVVVGLGGGVAGRLFVTCRQHVAPSFHLCLLRGWDGRLGLVLPLVPQAVGTSR